MKKMTMVLLISLILFLIGCTQPQTCGDEICSENENTQNCPQDCSATNETHSECNNEQCIQVQGAGTNQCTTNLDCISETTCGNNSCEIGENIQNCPQDCTDMNVDKMLNMCYGLTEQECNEYKIFFVKSVIEKYKDYHDNSDALFQQYENSNLFIEWDNNLDAETIGSSVGGHFPDPAYSFPLTKIYNSDFNRVLEELKKKHIILNYFVHGNPTTAGFGLSLNETESERNKIYTTNDEFIKFAFENGSAALLVDAKACGSWIVWEPNKSFCCWPQAMTGSGVWLYMDPSGGYEYQQNLQKKFSSGEITGKSLLEVPRGELYVHGDITAHLPKNGTTELSCEWADKQGIPCVCSPPEEKNKLAVIIKQNGIYDNQALINSINNFIESVELDTGISGSLHKFGGSSFEELDSFTENLYNNSNVAYMILIGNDLPIFESDGLQLKGTQELGTVNSIIENGLGCYNVAISYILPPLHNPQNCKKGETNCVEGQLYKCSDDNWVLTGESC